MSSYNEEDFQRMQEEPRTYNKPMKRIIRMSEVDDDFVNADRFENLYDGGDDDEENDADDK